MSTLDRRIARVERAVEKMAGLTTENPIRAIVLCGLDERPPPYVPAEDDGRPIFLVTWYDGEFHDGHRTPY